MKILDMLFNWLFGGLKSWAISLQDRIFIADEWNGNDKKEFSDPYADLDYMHDREMERLVKAINDAKDNHHMYQ